MSTGSKTIESLEEVKILDDKDQFLFFQNSSKKTKRITKGNMANSGGGLRGRFIDAATGNDVGATAVAASISAQLATATAQGAQTSANGKNEVYYQNDQPTVTSFTGYISGTTLNVTSASAGTVIVGKPITNTSIADATVITEFISGANGQVGIYKVSVSQNVASSTIYCGYNVGDLWYDTNDNYKLYVYQNTGSWQASFAPMLRLDGNNNITGFQKVGASDKDFVLVADNFQIWNGVSAQVPFEVKSNVVYIKDAQIQNVDVAKLTAGYISGKAIELSDSTAYIQSSKFIETWTATRTFTNYNSRVGGKKANVSDQDLCKVLQTDGTYKIFKSIQAANINQTPPASGNNSYWEELTASTTPTLDSVAPNITVQLGTASTTTFRDLGFRIVGSGAFEFASGIFRGAIVAKEGYFGNGDDRVRIDSDGLLINSKGRIKSSGLTYSSGGPGTGTKGFFLGNTGTVDEFFIGDPSKYLRWDGTNLSVSGNIVGGSTVGSSSDSGHGLTIYSPYGIRKGRGSGQDDIGVLTFTGGQGNGVYYGSQIDLVGSVFYLDSPGSGLAGDDGSGTLQLSAGYRTGSTYDGPLDGAIIFRTLREYKAPVSEPGNDNHSGAQRFRIELDGTVRVVYTGSNISGGTTAGLVRFEESTINTNAGRFLVEGNGNDKHVQIKNGKIEFSSTGTTVYDTNLFRHAADQLGTDDDIVVGVGTTRYLYFYRTGAQIVWPSSDGNFTGDTVNLRKGGTNLLKTDDDFEAVSVTSTSTKRVKKNIKKYKVGLDIVENLTPVSYKRKMNDQEDIGFIAEEVNEILPVIVRKDEENIPQSMDYSKLTVVLVNAVKELSAEIKELKKKLKDANAN